MNEVGFYPRKLLTLDILRAENEEEKEGILEAISKLKSPLGLALELINVIFTCDGIFLKEYSEMLDETKKVAFGLGHAEHLSTKYSDKLATYSLYQFALQQFIQSSFRARQGKSLEEVLKDILRRDILRGGNISLDIASSRRENVGILENILKGPNKTTKAKSLASSHDIDILADTKDKTIIIQIRSRDDTGGATAKPSLGELLRELMKEELSKEVLYIIYTWVKPKGSKPQQKGTLVNKLISLLNLEEELEKELKGENLEKEEYDKKIEEKIRQIKEDLFKGKVVKIKDNLKVCIAYGAEELIKTLWNEFGIKSDRLNEKLKRYSKILESLSEWDDLWLAYGIATLELQNLVTYGKTNAAILSQKLRDSGLEEKLKSKEYLKSYEAKSIEIAKEISALIRGDEDLIPFNAVGDKMNYIRDLILLKMVYENLKDILRIIDFGESTVRKIKELEKKECHKEEGQTKITDYMKSK